jgi:hypothetical protein
MRLYERIHRETPANASRGARDDDSAMGFSLEVLARSPFPQHRSEHDKQRNSDSCRYEWGSHVKRLNFSVRCKYTQDLTFQVEVLNTEPLWASSVASACCSGRNE